jgi:hypothetical protein
MTLALSDLNSFSRRFAEGLFAAHPEWRHLAEIDPEGFPEPGSLLVTVPSPVASRSLTIRTYGDQVTIDFGPTGWHDHFDAARSPRAAYEFRESLAFIADLLGERVVVTTRFLFGKRSWSRPQRTEHLRSPRFGRLEIYSWTGKHDAR